MSWPFATIGEVCEVVSGATPKTGKPEFWDGNVPWVTPKDLSELGQKHLSDTPRQITKAGLKSCAARMLPAQSVLFSSRAPIGLVAINTLPVCTNQGFKSLVPRFDLVSPDFLFWWLKTQEKHIQSKGRGATFKEVSKKIVEDLQIPFPPLTEQKRIAGILDAADALRAKRREALAQFGTLLQSTFLDMFGDPVTNPMGWEKPLLEDLCEKVIDCPHSTPRWSGSGVICLRTSNLGNGEWNWADTRFVTEEDYTERTRRSEILQNDIVLSREGTVGVLALVDEGMRLCMGQRLVQLRVNDSQLDPKFLLNLLLHDLAPERLSRLIAGSTSKHLNVKELRKLPVLLPPLDIQHRFAAIVESVEHQKASQRAHLAELDTLFASLQSRAFRGDL